MTDEDFKDTYAQLEIELHNLVEIYKNDPRDCADKDQPECIKDAMALLNRISTLRNDAREYHV